jgi:hypothetical protein
MLGVYGVYRERRLYLFSLNVAENDRFSWSAIYKYVFFDCSTIRDDEFMAGHKLMESNITVPTRNTENRSCRQSPFTCTSASGRRGYQVWFQACHRYGLVTLYDPPISTQKPSRSATCPTRRWRCIAWLLKHSKTQLIRPIKMFNDSESRFGSPRIINKQKSTQQQIPCEPHKMAWLCVLPDIQPCLMHITTMPIRSSCARQTALRVAGGFCPAILHLFLQG